MPALPLAKVDYVVEAVAADLVDLLVGVFVARLATDVDKEFCGQRSHVLGEERLPAIGIDFGLGVVLFGRAGLALFGLGVFQGAMAPVCRALPDGKLRD